MDNKILIGAGVGGLSGGYLWRYFIMGGPCVVPPEERDEEACRKWQIENTIKFGLIGAGVGGLAGYLISK